MRIRSARSDDWEACLALDTSYETEIAWQMEENQSDGEWSMCFREVRLPRKQRIAPLLTPEEQLNVWQRRDGFWIAAQRSQIQGYLGLVLEPDHHQTRITDLVVAPALRRQGIATQLLQTAIHWCQRQSVEQLILECPLKAQPAIGFARQHGFNICGFQDAYWPHQEAGLFFRKRLR